MTASVTVSATATSAVQAAAADPRLTQLEGHRRTFLGFLHRRVRTDADAEDLLQQGLLRAANRLGTLRDDSKLVPWFYRILRRLVAEHHAAWAVEQKRFDLLREEMDAFTPDEATACGCALGLLDELRPEYASILRAVDLDEEELADVARRLDVTVNNATVRLHRARKQLRDRVLALCGDPACGSCDC